MLAGRDRKKVTRVSISTVRGAQHVPYSSSGLQHGSAFGFRVQGLWFRVEDLWLRV